MWRFLIAICLYSAYSSSKVEGQITKDSELKLIENGYNDNDGGFSSMQIINAVNTAMLNDNVKVLELVSTEETAQLVHSLANLKQSNITINYNDLKWSRLTFTEVTRFRAVNQLTVVTCNAILKLGFFHHFNEFIFIFDSESDIEVTSFVRLMSSYKMQATAVNVSKNKMAVRHLFNNLQGAFSNFIVNCNSVHLKSIIRMALLAKANAFSELHNWIFVANANNNRWLYDINLYTQSLISWRYFILKIDEFETDVYNSAFKISMCLQNTCNTHKTCTDISNDVINGNAANSTLIKPFKSCHLNVYIVKYHDIDAPDTSYGQKTQRLQGIDWEIFNTIVDKLNTSYRGLKYRIFYGVSFLLSQTNDVLYNRVTYKVSDDKGLYFNPWDEILNKMHQKNTLMDMILPFGHQPRKTTSNNFEESIPVYDMVYAIISQRKKENDEFGDYIKPVEGSFGIRFFYVVMVAAVALGITYYVSPYSSFRNSSSDPQHQYTFIQSIFTVWYLILMQAHDGAPSYTSGRLVYVVVLIFGFMFMQYYAAVLISFLSIRFVKPTFITVSDVVMNPNFEIGADNSLGIVNILSESRDPLLRNLSERIMSKRARNLFYQPEDAIERIVEENLLYLTPLSRIELYLRLNCSLAVLVPDAVRVPKHLIFKKGFPFKHHFNRWIERLKSTGSIQRLYYKNYPQISNHCDISNWIISPLSYTTIQPVFLLLTIMFTFSYVVFLLEMSIEHVRQIVIESRVYKNLMQCMNAMTIPK